MLELGEPYSPAIYTFEQRGRSGVVALIFNVVGEGKEVLRDVCRIEGDRTLIPLSQKKAHADHPKEPSFKVMDAGGKVVHQGSFEYG